MSADKNKEAEIKEAVKPAETPVEAPAVDMEAVKAMAREMAAEMVKEALNSKELAEAKKAEAADEAYAKRIAYLEERVPVTVPFIEGKQEQIEVQVGMRPVFLIQCGEEVMVPRYVKEVLDRRQTMQARARRYQRAHNKRDENK